VAVTTEMVKELRERTGAGMMDCKRALDESGGDMEAAIRLLRERGKAQAAKKAGRAAGEGAIVSYVHGGRIGVLVEVNCETDFVARNEAFQSFAREVAMQVAASAPRYVARSDVPAHEVEAERAVLRAQAEATGKPPAVVERMVDGRLEKFFERVCLLEQAYIRDPERKVGDLVTELVARIGENIRVRRFVRWELGEAVPQAGADAAPEAEAEAAQAGVGRA
jgi:elongation factor Ts